MNQGKPTYEELEERLAVAEPIVEALRRHEVDAVVGEEKIAFLLLKGIEEAFQDCDAAFNALFELRGVGMFQAETPTIHFTRVNQKFCEITGYSAEELLAETIIRLTDPQDRRRAVNDLARLYRGKSDSWSIEKRCVRKDGRVIWVDVNGAVLRNHAGRAVKIIATVSDITARKHSELALRRKSSVEKGKPMRLKKAGGKKTRESASKKSSDKPRFKTR